MKTAPVLETSEGIMERKNVDMTKHTLKVLQVDDDPNFLKVAKQCLEMQGGFQVDTARLVEEAKEKMKKESYDVIVSDYQMPGKDGLEFLKELREKGNGIPFIIFTGKGREVATKALNLGADGYFSKIGDPETVYSQLGHGICQALKKESTHESITQSGSSLQSTLHPP